MRYMKNETKISKFNSGQFTGAPGSYHLFLRQNQPSTLCNLEIALIEKMSSIPQDNFRYLIKRF